MARKNVLGLWTYKDDLILRMLAEIICLSYDGLADSYAPSVDAESISTRHKYTCKSCRYKASVTAGTVMDRSHLGLRTWVWAIYLVFRDKRGDSAMQLSRVLNLPYNTAWFLLHRIRNVMAERDNRYLLNGIVDLDDTYLGKTKTGGKRGRVTTKNKAVVAISKGEDGKPQYVKMQVVTDLKGKTIAKFAQNSIVDVNNLFLNLLGHINQNILFNNHTLFFMTSRFVKCLKNYLLYYQNHKKFQRILLYMIYLTHELYSVSNSI